MNKLSSAWLFSEKIERYNELLLAAETLGKTVNVIAHAQQDTSPLSDVNIDALYTLAQSSVEHPVENYAETIAEAIKSTKSMKGVLLLSTSKRDKALAARLSILLEAPLINEVTAVRVESDHLLVEQRLYGGVALGLKKVNAQFALITLPPALFAKTTVRTKTERTCQHYTLDYLPPRHPLKPIERYQRTVDSVELSKAKCVVGIGRGIATQDDLSMIEALANCLNAQLGCTRPIAEGERWLGRERYIGISGVMLKCDLYLAIGISGQVQHMVGVNDAKVVIAINKDKNAPIFKSADYGIVADLYTLIPALIEKLTSSRRD